VDWKTDERPWRWDLAPPRPIVWAHAWVVVLPLAIAMLVVKTHAYLIAIEQYGFSFELTTWLGVLGPDIFTIIAYVFFWVIILSLIPRFDRRKRGRKAPQKSGPMWMEFLRWLRTEPHKACLSALTISLFQATTLAIFFFVVGSHIFNILAGIPLDGYLAAYALTQLDQLTPMIATKLNPWIFIGLLTFIGLLFALPFMLRRLKYAKRLAQMTRTRADWKNRRRAAPVAIAILFMLLSLGFNQISMPYDLTGLQSQRLVPIAKGLRAWFEEEDFSNLSNIPTIPPTTLEKTPHTQPYNVVIVILESVRARSIPVYGGTAKTMPTLSQLAVEGRFARQAYTVVPHTSKSVLAILCGQYPKLVMPIDEAELGMIPSPCLPELLRGKGYDTAFFQTATRGFERRDELVKSLGFQRFFGNEDLENDGTMESPNYLGLEDKAMLKPSLAWVKERKNPFLLTYLTLISHHDYKVPSDFKTQQFTSNPLLNAYYNTLVYTDEFVTELMEKFRHAGLLKNTLFVFLGDHGEGFNEHYRYEHDVVIYDEGLHIPVILYGAGLRKPGQEIKGLRNNTDILPTVVDILGYRLKGGLYDGKSLVSTAGHATLYHSCWYRNGCMALREGGMKTIYHYQWRPPQLFDMKNDPLEKQDLSLQFSGPNNRVEDAVKRMKSWRQKVNRRYRAHLWRQTIAPK
jgi:lipoteichoic acid synthase